MYTSYLVSFSGCKITKKILYMQEASSFFCIFHQNHATKLRKIKRRPEGLPLLPLMLRVILVAAHFPQIRLHGLFATGGVLLRLEVDLVLGDLHQVGLTSLDSRCHGAEACACIEFVGRERGAAFHFLTQVHAVTIRVLGCCYTVGTEQHLCARVLTVLARFAECAGYAVNTGTPFYMSHNS